MSKVDVRKDALELLIPELKEYFLSTLGHKYLTAVQDTKEWGQYYFAGRRQTARKSWVLEIIYMLNQSMPSFNEIFDQQCTIRYFLNNYDCVVQAPTGYGKTLAYILSTLQLIQQKRTPFNEMNKCEIYALIVVPSRELVVQIYGLLKSICEQLKLKVLRLVGGVKIQPEKFFKGQCIMIATPGCLEHWSEQLPTLKNYLKFLLVLILDEADRYSDAEFKKSMTSFMAMLPKQRRTCLFSATQAKHVEEFLKFGLRNPIRLNVTSDKNTNVSESLEVKESTAPMTNGLIVPAELTNYYTLIEADEKLLALVNFLNANAKAKVLIFVCSSATVEYIFQILSNLLDPIKVDKKVATRPVFAVYGKLDKKHRAKILAQFRKTDHAILLSTDLMARGLDIIDINWVLQFDIPKYSSMFIHRSGRTARIGNKGNSLILLTKEEAGYVEYIQNHEKINLKKLDINGLGVENAKKLRVKVQDLAIADRAVLINGTRAFVSFVQAYLKHDCNIVCRVDDLNLAGIAHAFGLLRLPQMVELKKCMDRLKETFEVRYDVRTSQIPYKDAKLEAGRHALSDANKVELNSGRKISKRKVFADEDPDASKKKQVTKKKPKSDWEYLKQSANVLKKFKKGKLSKTEMEELL